MDRKTRICVQWRHQKVQRAEGDETGTNSAGGREGEQGACPGSNLGLTSNRWEGSWFARRVQFAAATTADPRHHARAMKEAAIPILMHLGVRTAFAADETCAVGPGMFLGAAAPAMAFVPLMVLGAWPPASAAFGLALHRLPVVLLVAIPSAPGADAPVPIVPKHASPTHTRPRGFRASFAARNARPGFRTVRHVLNY